MSDILVRGMDEETVARLKSRARRNGRSLQSELKQVLEDAASLEGGEVAEMLKRWETRLAGRRFAESAELIREDRDR